MIIFLGVIAFCFLLYVSVSFRLAVLHPFKSVFYVIKDVVLYFVHHDYDRYDGGTLNCYFAHFGGGKTLTATSHILSLYKRYNNKKVWDRDRKKMVLQKVHVLSNVHLVNVPYEKLESLGQIVTCAYYNKDIDLKNDTRTVVLTLLDEASSELNSRQFKDNLSPEVVNTLITSRHFHMSIFYTSQKFKLVDALLRSVTQKCIHCRKIWRFMVLSYYDADELEYAVNPTLVKPLQRIGFFIRDMHYANYDTLATVDKLKKKVDERDFLSEQEVIELRGNLNPDYDAITTPSRKLKRIRKRGA